MSHYNGDYLNFDYELLKDVILVQLIGILL